MVWQECSKKYLAGEGTEEPLLATLKTLFSCRDDVQNVARLLVDGELPLCVALPDRDGYMRDLNIQQPEQLFLDELTFDEAGLPEDWISQMVHRVCTRNIPQNVEIASNTSEARALFPYKKGNVAFIPFMVIHDDLLSKIKKDNNQLPFYGKTTSWVTYAVPLSTAFAAFKLFSQEIQPSLIVFPIVHGERLAMFHTSLQFWVPSEKISTFISSLGDNVKNTPPCFLPWSNDFGKKHSMPEARMVAKKDGKTQRGYAIDIQKFAFDVGMNGYGTCSLYVAAAFARLLAKPDDFAVGMATNSFAYFSGFHYDFMEDFATEARKLLHTYSVPMDDPSELFKGKDFVRVTWDRKANAFSIPIKEAFSTNNSTRLSPMRITYIAVCIL